ncbi:thiamine-phosphate kinase [Lysobacter enzymogenes]|uniref:thiamine-phosphate kinase n=1 Tax=Lysobacter enzymogenes TaxID=69 RepID=UPI00374A983D
MTAEFDLIAAIRARAAALADARGDIALGIGDDAALLSPPPGRQLVVATDTLNRGVHFAEDAAAADIGWKALAVNLSDLAAMGAEPAWCTLSLSLPDGDARARAAFVEAFADGFLELAARHRVALVGGDTTRGPLSVCVTAMGFVEPGWALRRYAAGVGDEIWVTGTLGDAGAALALDGIEGYRDFAVRSIDGHGAVADTDNDGDATSAWLYRRLRRPQPRVAAGRALRGLARAGIDVSDGLLADLGHVCAASGVGANLDAAALPASPALLAACAEDARRALQLGGGDDYELCFTAPARQRDPIARALAAAGTPATVIGRIEAEPGVRVRLPDGSAWTPPRRGYQHFD